MQLTNKAHSTLRVDTLIEQCVQNRNKAGCSHACLSSLQQLHEMFHLGQNLFSFHRFEQKFFTGCPSESPGDQRPQTSLRPAESDPPAMGPRNSISHTPSRCFRYKHALVKNDNLEEADGSVEPLTGKCTHTRSLATVLAGSHGPSQGW